MQTRTRRSVLAAALGLSLLLSGCSGTQDQGGSAIDRATALVDQVRAAVEQAKQRNQQESGQVPRTARTAATQIRTDTRTAFDYAEYSGIIEQVLASLEAYWAKALPASFGASYSSPSRYVYYRPEEQPGPSCGGQPAPAKNAFYCSDGDFIAWDESGLIIPYYVGAGDFAAAFVLAHEFGHAMQQRLPRKEQLGVLRELQADCFAGAWARSVQDEGYLQPGDLDEATLAVFSARDVPGTEFTDPAAHGTGFERTRAFADGFEGGPTACYPAPRDKWLIGS